MWTGALMVLALNDPRTPDMVDLCLIDALGLPFCPGEGLGRAIAFLARGEWREAIAMHWGAPLVVAVLVHRITSLLSFIPACRK